MPPCEGGYKEFKIGELFKIKKGKRLTKAQMVEGSTNFIGATATNNGVTARIGNKGHIHPAGTITVTYNGSVGEAFYQMQPFWASDDVNVLYPKFEMTEHSAIYFLAPLRKKGKSYGYSYKWTKEMMENDSILLPVTKSGEIDFQYIEERMRELEEERMRELEAYLAAAGFANCDLTLEEQVALRKFSNGEVKFTSFRIGDHFERLALGIHKKFNKSTDVSKESNAEFNIPLVNAKHGNNGIMYYGKECDYDTAEMTIDIVNDGAVSTGDVYAQPQKTGVLYNAYLVKCTSYELDANSILYFSTAIGKSIKMKYGYDKKASWERVQNDSMILPTTPDGEIDYKFMEDYISAIKKQIIQQVKDYIAREHKIYEHIIK